MLKLNQMIKLLARLLRQEEEKNLLKQLEQRNKEISLKMGNIEDQVETINDLKVLATEVDVPNAKAIRSTMDDFKSKLQDAIIVLASNVDGKVSIIATVPKSLTDQLKLATTKTYGTSSRRKRWRTPHCSRWCTQPEKITEALRFIKDYIKNL